MSALKYTLKTLQTKKEARERDTDCEKISLIDHKWRERDSQVLFEMVKRIKKSKRFIDDDAQTTTTPTPKRETTITYTS